VHRFKKRGGASKSRESFDFAAFALWQKDAEHRFFSVRNTYLFASSRMWSAFPAVLLIGFCNSIQIQETWRIQLQDVSFASIL
jgi:hypothetical protein